MKKGFAAIKRAVSLLMVFAMVLSMLPVGAAAAEPDTVTVYFENNWKWSDVRAFYWGNEDTKDNPDWPGMEMTKIDAEEGENEVYYAILPADITGLIFNGLKDDGSGYRDQSPDITGKDIADSNAYRMHWDQNNQYKIFDYTPPTFSVSFDGTGVEFNGGDTAVAGKDYTATLSAKSGYELPGSVSVSVDGETASDYSYSGGKLTVPASAVTGDISVTAQGVKLPEVYSVTFSGTHVTFSGASEVTEGEDYSATLTPEEGYTLPESIAVKSAGENASHSYSPETGHLSIAASAITGDIAVTAAGVAVPAAPEMKTVYFQNNWLWTDVKVHYWDSSLGTTSWPGNAMTFVENDGTYDIYSAQVPEDAKGFLFNGIKNDGSGALDQTQDLLDFAPGKCYYMTWSDGNKAVTFDYTPGASQPEPTPEEYSVTFNGTNVTSDGAAKVTEGEDYSATLTAAEGYTLPESISVKCGDADVAHSYNAENGLLTVAASAITGDITVAATGVAVPAAPEMKTVYFQNNWLWTDVKVHYWDSSLGATGWPGNAMTFVENDGTYDIYSAQVPEDAKGFLFNGIKNDGSGALDQTQDLQDFAAGKCYYMTWSDGNKAVTFDYTPGASQPEPTPEEYSVTFNGTNVTSDGAAKVTEGEDYSATLTAAEGYTLPESISVKCGDADVAHSYSAETGLLTVAASAITGDITVTAAGVAVPAGPEMKTVYFRNNWLWTDVKVHYWGSSLGETSWPGNAMTLVENDGTHDIYSAQVPEDATGFLFNGIKNDGSGALDQTPDLLDFAPGKCYYMHWDGENKALTEDYTPGSTEETETGYYLVGYINSADYNGNDYAFVDGSLTATFTADSYVAVKDTEGNWYMSQAYCTDKTVTLAKGNTEKMFVAGNVENVFTLTENADGTLTLSYAPKAGEAESVEYTAIFHLVNTLGWSSANLYAWLTEPLAGGWPGTAMTKDADGLYSLTLNYEAPAGQGLNVIFNNGSAQTVDLALAAEAFTDNKTEKWVELTGQTDGKYNAVFHDSADAIAVSPTVDGTSVTFQYKNASASSVEVRGTMNGWSEDGYAMTQNAHGIWSCTVKDLTPGVHEYKFVVNGTDWVLDPLNGQTANGNSAFTVLNPDAEDTNRVTVRIHYTRTDGNYDGRNLWVWSTKLGGHQVDFTETDDTGAKVATIRLEDARAHQSISFKPRKSVAGNEWADNTESDYVIDLADIVSGTLDYYVTAGSPSGSLVLGNDVVKAVKLISAELDYDSNTVVIKTGSPVADYEKAFELVELEGSDAPDFSVAQVSASGTTYTLTLEQGQVLDLVNLYKYQVKFQSFPYAIDVDAVYASDKFAEEFTYTGKDLGAAYSSGSTTFKVWAPTAESVSVKLYATGSDGESGAQDLGSHKMTAQGKGVWSVQVEGDLKNVYYTYAVTVGGETVEAVDPYARSAGVNGERGMVVDLDGTDPADGWSEISNKPASYTDAVIYELHVRDFSIDDSSGVKDAWQGKFLGLTQTGTTTAKGTPTGLDYLKQLGITHLHLLPVYDYESVDESKLDIPQFNWGYDPQNYNVPEGSYSTNPYDGQTRVREMKEMVDTLHENNIGVIMDVVYNHVYDADTFCFNNIVPGYFSRVNSNTSGCGNDTASEREMVRKFIVDSVLYWAKEYHIDGFRFDLVGLIDVETINQIVSEVHAVRPDILFYGEGWDMDGTNREPGTEMAKQANAYKTPGFAYFSDSMRNNVGGSNGKSTGFASGAGNGAAIASDWMAKPSWTANPTQIIQYASCHDNYTLADKLIISTNAGSLTDSVIRMNNLAAAFYMTSQGIPFIHAGEEFLREKLDESGNRAENSYNASDYVNHLRWSNLDNDAYAANVEYYKGLIALRKAHPALRYDTAAEVAENVRSTAVEANLLSFRVDGNGAGDDDLLIIFNANKAAKTVTLPEGQWTVLVRGDKAGTASLGSASGSISVEGISAMVLSKPDTGKDEKEPLGASEEKTLYFSNNKGWSKVYAYAWTDGGEKQLLGQWPGKEMTFVQKNEYNEDIYCVTLPASETGIEGVIFHGNSDGNQNQTVDVAPGIDGTGYYCSTQAADGKWEVGTYTFRAPTLGAATDYFLVGYINGTDYAGGEYKFDGAGKVKTTFSSDSYVYVVNGTNSEVYMTDGYLGSVTSGILKDTAKHALTADKWDKLLIPGGAEVTVTMVKNGDNTVTLSYEMKLAGVEDTSGIQDGVTLHCWNWSFKEIQENMAAIADQGYTAIQTSPVQVMKEATNLDTNSVGTHWWVYYQPVDFKITTDSGNALGTKAELESMIQTAHRYGVKVIVDVVANHLGNQTGNDLSDKIPEYLREDEYWHDITTNISSWSDRYDMTQHCLDGLPDLNTANKEIQGYVLDFLKECIDIGVDGFRFDMAKSIETPMDDASFASDFWPTVIGGAEQYAQSKGKDVYMYGEVLDNSVIAIAAYTQYMAVTDNSWGNNVRTAIANDSASVSAGYHKSAQADNLVIWAESHDTYSNNASSGVSQEDISKTWALIAARADAMGLYLARPESMEQALGVASETGWENPEIRAINRFHNAFHGQSETLSSEGSVVYVERGTTGAILVNAGQSLARAAGTQVSVPAHNMADGTYTDQITGNPFTVADGRISGEIGATGIAVVYNAGENEQTFTVTVEETSGGSAAVSNGTPKAGETVIITAEADTGKVIDRVSVTDAADNAVAVTDLGDGEYSFVQPYSNVTVEVTFKDAPQEDKKHTVTVSVSAGGKAVISDKNPATGDTVTVTAQPNTGKQVKQVTVTDEKGKPVTLTGVSKGVYRFVQPDSDVTVSVSFEDIPKEEIPKHKVTLKKATGGTVTVSPTAPETGATVTVTAKPSSGKQVDKVTVTDAAGKTVKVTAKGNGKYTFTQPDGDVTVSVTFKDAPVQKYKVTVKKSLGGTVKVSSTNPKAGDTVTVTAKANSGWSIRKVTVTDAKGNTVKLTDKGNGKYTFVQPESNVAVKGTFQTNSSSPATGDTIAMWMGIMTLSTLALAALLIFKRRTAGK